MTSKPLNVLFLCTHNAARSILAEAVLNHVAHGRFKAYSAGSSPRENAQPHPMALEVLAHAGVNIDGLSSKSWDVFSGPDAPHMDLIITVCDHAAGEVCPVWPGHPATAHWGYADPSRVEGDESLRRDAFRHTMLELFERMALLLALPPEKLQHALEVSAKELAQAG